jgi:hypothetical protein
MNVAHSLDGIKNSLTHFSVSIKNGFKSFFGRDKE